MQRYFSMILMLFFLHCSIDNVASVTETDTGQITGLVVYSNGEGVNNADVIMRHQSFVKKIVLPLGKKLARSAKENSMEFIGKRIDSTKTSPAGFFSFDSVDTGKYYVEVNDHDTLGALAEAEVTLEEPLCVIDSIVLKRMGYIEGMVDKSLIDSQETTYIYVSELYRKVSVDSSGYFFIANLPVWYYNLRVVVGDSTVSSPLDTFTVVVNEDDTTKVANVGSGTGTVIIDGKIKEYGE